MYLSVSQANLVVTESSWSIYLPLRPTCWSPSPSWSMYLILRPTWWSPSPSLCIYLIFRPTWGSLKPFTSLFLFNYLDFALFLQDVSKLETCCLTSTETIRLIRDEEIWGSGVEVIHTYILLNVLRCYLEHIRMGVEAVVPQQQTTIGPLLNNPIALHYAT